MSLLFSALRESLADASWRNDWRRNLLAGVTVGIVALPLSMGLAIASGVPPQHGLYTAILGGIIIAITGGSRVNVSGPTAAFVVVLLPIVQTYGLGGLLVSGFLAGLILIGFGLLRLGRIIQVIPYPVIVGFTAGIGAVIATLQLKDLLGLHTASDGIHYHEKLIALIKALPSLRWQELVIACATFATIGVVKRITTRIPPYLVALVVGALLGGLFNTFLVNFPVDTIASRFSYTLNGVSGTGIPEMLPQLILPWNLPAPNGQPIGLSLNLIQMLLGAAFAIAVLGALESLLCAVVSDGMSGFKHHSDAELIGQGIGNLCVAMFGGIPATAAIARTATNVRAGATAPLAAVVHGLTVLLAMLVLAHWLGYIPMASMAAILTIVAWNMSEARHAVRIIRKAPRSDAAVFVTCFLLTVFLDMQIAVAAGLALASLVFIRRMIDLTGSSLVDHKTHTHALADIPDVVVYDIDGPLFFGAAYKALKTLLLVDKATRFIVLDMRDVSMLDVTAMMTLESTINELRKRHIKLFLCHVKANVAGKLQRYGIAPGMTTYHLTNDIESAAALIKQQRDSNREGKTSE
ncbi:MAG: C4-dicarboxylic acid transporter DauA [Gammaproteobacteria bacterium]|nr:C4-dicarboxylic acid transporter DauA [Gammaproteobacteria bacterium]